MKEELKQKMIGVIGSYSNPLIESIAERCAQVAIDFYEKRNQALSMSGVVGRSEQLACPECENPYPHGHVDGSYSCEDCGNKWAS